MGAGVVWPASPDPSLPSLESYCRRKRSGIADLNYEVGAAVTSGYRNELGFWIVVFLATGTIFGSRCWVHPSAHVIIGRPVWDPVMGHHVPPHNLLASPM